MTWQAIHFDTTQIDRTATPECGGTGTATAASAQPEAPTVAFQAGTVVVGELFNPLGTTVTIPGFIARGIRAVLGLIGAVALLMFIYGGVLWMTAGGESKKVETAKTILRNSLFGIVIILLSYSIVAAFFGILLSGS